MIGEKGGLSSQATWALPLGQELYSCMGKPIRLMDHGGLSKSLLNLKECEFTELMVVYIRVQHFCAGPVTSEEATVLYHIILVKKEEQRKAGETGSNTTLTLLRGAIDDSISDSPRTTFLANGKTISELPNCIFHLISVLKNLDMTKFGLSMEYEEKKDSGLS
ncbi:hypothetical protein llap_2987 [Limosa lapponica baueri]|uniref:Uncharacterized protein n=1 Tax=Limosa lapponica baueri TaxID=1758121 RepID=A0A2I0UL18_LIMLA|nr:hypothetical protein llap_2987 [Limosa lapponica baueri]